MIFRNVDSKLYKIELDGEDDSQFMSQQGDSSDFIQISESALPKINDGREIPEYFYLLTDKGISIDMETTNKKWIKYEQKQTEKYIYAYYSERKQSQDNVWFVILLYKLKLKNKDIERTISTYVTMVDKDTPVEELGIESDYPDDFSDYIKLVKISVRREWLVNCINEYHNAVKELREPVFKEM